MVALKRPSFRSPHPAACSPRTSSIVAAPAPGSFSFRLLFSESFVVNGYSAKTMSDARIMLLDVGYGEFQLMKNLLALRSLLHSSPLAATNQRICKFVRYVDHVDTFLQGSCHQRWDCDWDWDFNFNRRRNLSAKLMARTC